MEVRAIAKYVRVQPRKVRIIADEVRGKSAVYTASLLRYHPSKSAKALRKVLISAMANAQENHGISPEQLRIATIMVDEGPKLKRITQKAMGRGARIEKKTSHITVVVAEDETVNQAVRPHGTKAKPRPTFGSPARGRRATGGATTVTVSASAPVAEEPVTPGETTDTDAEETTAAATPEEAKPVTAADAPEEAGSVNPPAEQEETTSAAEGADTDEAGASEDKEAQ